MDGAVLKKITLDGTISNINTSSITSPLPNGLTADNHGNMYISKSYSGVHKITLPAGTVTSMGTGNVSEICRIAVAEDGTIYNSSDSYEGIIRKKTLANSSGQDWIGGYGNYGYVDGPVTTARINYGPRALQFNSAGNLLILDANNFAIREVDMVAETVSTIVKVTRGFTDGDLVSAQWGYAPSDMAIDKDDNIYLLDTSNKAVRKIILK